MERGSSNREHGHQFTPGKSTLVHDTLGIVPGKKTLAMAQMPATPVSGQSHIGAPGDAVHAGLRDGINLEGGAGLVDKTSGEVGASTGASLHDNVDGGADGGSGAGDGGAGSGGGAGAGGAGDGGGAGGGGGSPAAVGIATFGVIDYPTTPAGVGRRIPPRKDVNVAVTLTGLAPSTNAVISFDGAGAGGTGTLDGAATKSMAAGGSVKLRGTGQTAAGSAGTLSLVAKVGTTEIGRSNTFTICAIPTTVSVAFAGLITGSERGIKMTTSNDSDSGSVGDLDQVHMSEMVQYQGGTGCFAGITSGSNSGYLAASNTPHGVDSHGTPAALVTGAGYIESVQGFKFKDARSGAADIGVAHSGFMITRTAEVVAAKKYLTTAKAGAATTVSGISVAAGSGSATKRQEV
ncbi:MAG TPA: hypothetical protein VGD37_08610 [Kofleriaceae bacterium]|jgi:hypothetical protein